MIFDLIASQYGLTFRQIGKMTFREVFIAFDAIMERRKQEMIFQAKCMGAEIKEDENIVSSEELSDSQINAMEKAREELMDKWKKRNLSNGRFNDKD